MAVPAISADSHLEVPCDRWVHRVDPRYRERVPRRIRLANGGDAWLVEGQPLRICGLELCGKPYEEYTPTGVTYEESRGTGSPQQRLEEQDEDGVLGEVLFTGVGGPTFWRGIADDNAYRAVIRGYNDWLAEEYCSVAPDRLLGLGVIPETSIDDAIAELRHCAELGLAGVVLNSFPSGLGYPTDSDDAFWQEALTLHMPVTVHVNFKFPTYSGPVFKYARQPADLGIGAVDIVRRYANYAIRGGLNVVQLVTAGVFDRFPDLRILFAENMIGWIPHWLEQWDNVYDRNIHWARRYLELKPLRQRPSDYVREHILWGFMYNPFGVRVRHEIGVKSLMWSSDFPHGESDWPHSQRVIAELFGDVPADERDMMLTGNVREFFHITARTPA